MEKKKIFIATPIHTNTLILHYVTSVFKLTDLFNKNNSEYELYVQFRHGSLINRCRNELVNIFMETNFDYIFFIDSDIVNFEQQFLSIINAFFILEPKIPLLMLGAIYPIKYYNFHHKLDYTKENWPEGLLYHNANIPLLGLDNEAIMKEADMNNGFVLADQIAGGFMMFSKKSLEKMFEYYPERRYNRYHNDISQSNNYLYNLFDSYIEQYSGNKHYLSEDYAFCELFKKAGGQIYANIKLPLSHFGEHAFTGSLYNSLLLNKDYNKLVDPVNFIHQEQHKNNTIEEQKDDNIKLFVE